jgi:fructokinase
LFPDRSIDEVYDRYFLPEKKQLIVTRGAQCVILKTPDFEKHYPVAAIEPVSTIGAGDGFNAGVVYALLQNEIPANGLSRLPESVWDALIASGGEFAQKVCLSLENYPQPPKGGAGIV